MPARREGIQQAHQGFHAVAGIPQVLGLVDGTLIPVSNPSVDDQMFICRKGYSAINTQVVVDHNGLIVDVVAKWPGSTHDSYIWANSAVGQDAARGVFGRGFFLGDSGYPLRTYLMTPVANPVTQGEQDFNDAHIRSRGLVERTIGRWKHRFRCIHRLAGGLKFSPAKCCAVIVVTAMLHNITVRARAHMPPEDNEDEEDDDAEGDNPPPPENRAAQYNAGFQARQNIINIFG
ncbi:putative nuclease HARBI1 [Anguilla anguilla]|uniref:putative nuclease HARBI1 n=1 Tax=Anguilla anguilla TaxID=7936 RepID=UPI0015A7BC3E|nr:putative nuclease HARBI1 [Anguilla anguilla]